MTSSRHRTLLQGAIAQSIVRRLTIASPIRSANASQGFSRSSSSTHSELNTTTPLSISPRATPIANVPTPILLALDAPVFASHSLSTQVIAVPAPVPIEELLKLFIQTYMNTIKNQT